MARSILYDPLISWPLLWLVVVVAVLFVGFAAWRRLSGWWLRALAFAAAILALANPSVQIEDRDPLSDIAIIVADESASQRIAGRPDQVAEAVAELEAEIASLPNTEVRVVTVGDSPENEGTLLLSALGQALAEEPRDRIAGAILVTDGQVHDLEATPELTAPLHTLLTGEPDDWDRRLLIQNAPAFAIVGEPVTMTMMIEDQGAVPAGIGARAEIDVSVDGGEPQRFTVPVGTQLELPVTLNHGGMNVIQFTLPESPGELTDRNNSAVVQINGVRDRLRVLLVSGEPHAGERTWRNLLKSDASVDLVHFTILRPPEKQDGVPVTELSLIAFPTRELFLDKIDEFDLIIFDRYKRRGILPSIYLDNVRQYVEDGGAVLIAAGPDFATAESIYRSPLAAVVPAGPTSRVIEEPFVPEITDIGQRHPVTEGLDAIENPGAPDDQPWGSWLRLIEVEAVSGHTVLSGMDDRPLLQLDRVGDGRVALLASDHAWLWSRGYEGGGPQLELLRRLAHWMMKEPELEEEALQVQPEGQSMTITRRTLEAQVAPVEITGPNGETVVVTLEETSPGRFQTTWDAPETGLYRLTDGELESVIALGPSAPREYEETIASGEKLEPVVDATRGGIMHLSDGVPSIRQVSANRPAAGRGWIGLTPREAYVTVDVSNTPILPSWAFLLIAVFFAVAAWLYEGRRGAKAL